MAEEKKQEHSPELTEAFDAILRPAAPLRLYGQGLRLIAAERVRIQGIPLNDVQAEHQESDEHIKGLDAVIKTQDKAIRDLKSRVVELTARLAGAQAQLAAVCPT